MPAAFHPAVQRWFERTFRTPTEAQAAAWPQISARQHVLIAAPTGSGKTLAAFLAVIDALVREGLAAGSLPDETFVVYVSPLKALSNDIHKNLVAPLAGIRAELAALGLPELDIRTFVRTGDTPQHERAAMRRRPPHIVVTTPESLYILMGSASGRAMLASTRTVIVDEIHAMAASKRGAHLALTLERLEALAGRRLTRIGLSATQKPIEDVARFLVGTRNLAADGRAACAVIDAGHVRARDLQLEIPASPLEAVMSGEVWTQTLRPPGAAGDRAPHHAGVRQHAPPGRAPGAPSVRARRRGARHRAPRQPRQGVAPGRRAALEERRAARAGGDRLTRARHRHRRCGPGVPAELAALDRRLPAARRALRPQRRRHAQGAAVPGVAR